MENRLIIIGASGHGKSVADAAIKENRWKEVVFFDDNEAIKSSMGLKVMGRSKDVFKYIDEADFFVAVGNNSIREKIQEMLLLEGASIASIIHPSAVIGTNVVIGVGTVVMAGVVVNSSSVIGKGCIINTSCSLDHDNILGDYVHISPGANLAGDVKIGKGSWIGVGSTVSNNVDICSSCIIGAGAVVISDIIKAGTYVGVPVKRLDR